MTVVLPAGLRLAPQVIGKRGFVTLSGASIRTLSLSRGHLVITLRKPASSVVVKIRPNLLRESSSFERRAKHGKLGKLSLRVITENTKGRRTTIRAQIIDPGL